MTSSSAKPAQSMAELMAKMGSKVQPIKKGDSVTGKITKLSSQEILLTSDNGTAFLVIEKDRRLHKQLMHAVKEGDRVEGIVLFSESDEGYPVVSLRKFVEEKVWANLEKMKQAGEKVSATVLENTKGGLVLETDLGIEGFLPNSHMGQNVRGEEMVGQKVSVSLAELSREAKKVVFSQKASLTPADFTKIAEKYKSGTKVQGVVSGITAFGVFVSLPYETGKGEKVSIDGLVHISEVSWEKVGDLHDLFASGDTVEAVVIGSDARTKRIDLSIKRLTADPFEKIASAFPVDKKVSGTVTELTELGVVLDLGEVAGVLVEGLIKKDKVPAGTTYEVGQKINATVVSLDSKKHKIMLTPVLLEKPLMYR